MINKGEAPTNEGEQPAGVGQAVSEKSTRQEDASTSISPGDKSSGERQETDTEPESEGKGERLESEGKGERLDETRDEL